ncbi:hypothetical protein CFC21_026099 [Triticum aestivum]|uniref:Uncharacterized protein n=2 Tax=Triticum aestivum TaxID=4565 RepID=A0A9R1EKM0_WHEAT|nr:hypothetical protein CFC21_026099 [Triticum aestivum]
MAVAGAACASRPPRSPRWRGPASPRAAAGAVEIRVCTNHTCARQGGREVLVALEGLSQPPPRVDVASCGCLGPCGAGPNVGASIPGRGNAVFGHVSTSSAPPSSTPQRGSPRAGSATGGDHRAGRHGARCSGTRETCKVRIGIGGTAGALADAEEAIRIAPSFPHSHLLRGDALFAPGDYHSAEDAFARALDLDPSIRRSKSFKARLEKLREKLVSVSSSS